MGLNDAEVNERVTNALKIANLEESIDRSPYQMSHDKRSAWPMQEYWLLI